MEHKNEKDEEILYQGNHVPKAFKFVYFAFGAWAIIYMVQYLFPDLMMWLKK